MTRGVPSVTPGPVRLNGTNLFESEPRGTTLDHFLVQTVAVVTGSREGGFFHDLGELTK